MDDGVCKVSRRTGDGDYRELFTMGKGTWGDSLAPGEALQLDPQGHGGEYSVQFEAISPAPGMGPVLASGFGMIVVAVGAVIAWRRIAHAEFRWFGVGAGLWAVAVAVKVAFALLSNAAVLGFLKSHLSYPLLVAGGGLFLGLQSSLCEMGLTLLAVWIWRQLGKEGGRAIAIGVGAGAFEAFLLGLAHLAAATAVIAGVPGTEAIREQFGKTMVLTPLFWLAGPAERVIAILCHASSRALILLGMAHQRLMMIVWGFVLFTLLDGIAGAAHVSGKLGTFSSWWIELAVLPFAFVSVPVLGWCFQTWCPDRHEARLANGSPQELPGKRDNGPSAPAW
jgi:hypothetical protein